MICLTLVVPGMRTYNYLSIARFVILNHVAHHLRFQPCFVHCETQLVRPVFVLDEVLDVHFGNFASSVLI